MVADPPQEAASFRRKIGGAEEESLKGLATAGTTADSPPANGAAVPAAGEAASGAHPIAIDTTDRKDGGLPAAKPVGLRPRSR